MRRISVRLPDYLPMALKEAAGKETVSMNQFIARALVKKLLTLTTEESLEKRAARGGREKFERTMSKVPDVESLPEDIL